MTIVGDRVELQLLTTLKCNLSCTYCSMAVGDVIQKNAPPPTYSVQQLQSFVRTHLDTPDTPRDVYITFYGGEPTLNIPFMHQVMEAFPLYRFQLQTNGTLLDNVPSVILRNLSNILVSIDGGQTITDGYRGKGIYKQVLKHIQHIRPLTDATITARVTYSNPQTTFEELDELTKLTDYLYFQFVADAQYEDITLRYPLLDALVDKFFAQPLYPIVPLMGIVRNKLFPSLQYTPKTLTQCRASTHLINVMPDGEIYPCPDMLYDKSLRMGSVTQNELAITPFHNAQPTVCTSCEAYSWCRTNCLKNLLLAEKYDDYASTVVNPICELVKYLGRAIDRHDLHDFYKKLTVPQRQKLRNAEIYDYVEIMP